MQEETLSKVESVYQFLEDNIVRGVWPVGGLMPKENDLAAQLGFSRPTISKAISRLEHEGMVERRKRSGTRVLRSTKDQGKPAVQLDAFAFIYPSDKHETIWRTVSGFQDAARETGRRTLMLTTAADHRKDAELFSRLDEFDVKGVVIYPSLITREDNVHFTQMLLKPKVPVVLTVNFPGLGFPSVVVDGFHAGYTMTRHLIQSGAKRIGHLSNGAWSLHMRDRYLGYCWALEEAGLVEPENGVLLEAAMHPNFRDPIAEPKYIAKAFLEKAGRLDAVMCANDFLAIGLIVAAREAGLSLPDDLRITGVDDLAIAASEDFSLTSYQIPFEDRGRIAYRLLEELMLGKSRACLETRLRGKIVIRQSA